MKELLGVVERTDRAVIGSCEEVSIEMLAMGGEREKVRAYPDT